MASWFTCNVLMSVIVVDVWDRYVVVKYAYMHYI